MKNNSRRGFKKEKRYRSDKKEFGCVVRSRPGENPEKLVMRFKFVSKSQLKRQKKLRAIRRLTKAKG